VPENGTKHASFANAACGNCQRRTRCLQSPHAAFEITPCGVCGILTPKCVQKQVKSTCFVRRTLQNGTLKRLMHGESLKFSACESGSYDVFAF
jgi:hypothetical protein